MEVGGPYKDEILSRELKSRVMKNASFLIETLGAAMGSGT